MGLNLEIDTLLAQQKEAFETIKTLMTQISLQNEKIRACIQESRKKENEIVQSELMVKQV